MVKKLSAALIAMLMLFSCSFAAFSASADVSANTVYGNTGDTVRVVVKLESNPGLACLGLFVEYDSSSLTLSNVFDEGLLGVSARFKDLGGGKLSMSWGDKGERNIYYTKTGELVSLAFKIMDNAKSKKYAIRLSYDKNFTDDKNANPVTLNVTDGAIVVSAKPVVSPTDPQGQAVTTASSGGNNGGQEDKSTGLATAITGSGQSGSAPEIVTDENGEIQPGVTHYTNIPVTDKNGNVVYAPGADEITDEDGSMLLETAEPDPTDTDTQEITADDVDLNSGRKLKVVLIIVVLLLAFLLIFLLTRLKRKPEDK